MEVELLILIKNDNSFCNNVNAFKSFLNVDSQLSISKNKITLKLGGEKSISADFQIETGDIESKKERYFLVSLKKDDKSPVDNFNELILKIKDIANRINPGNSVINVVWDDVGRHYATEAYPVLNNVENLMRKLISKFLLINVGMNWSKETMVPDLIKKIANHEDDNDHYVNDLFKIDFIHLSDFLFAKKRDLTLSEVDRILAKGNFDKNDTQLLSSYLPRSNWEKYFSSIIEQDQSELEENWKRLYKLRNKVAHNRFLTKRELSETIGVSGKVTEVLNKAIRKLTEIDLDETQRSLIIEEYNSKKLHDLRSIKSAVKKFYGNANFEILQHQENRLDFIASHDETNINVHIIPLTIDSRFRSVRRSVLRIVQQSHNKLESGEVAISIIHLIVPPVSAPKEAINLIMDDLVALDKEVALPNVLYIGYIDSLGQLVNIDIRDDSYNEV